MKLHEIINRLVARFGSSIQFEEVGGPAIYFSLDGNRFLVVPKGKSAFYVRELQDDGDTLHRTPASLHIASVIKGDTNAQA